MEWENIKFPKKLNPPGLFIHPEFTRGEAEGFLVQREAAGSRWWKHPKLKL